MHVVEKFELITGSPPNFQTLEGDVSHYRMLTSGYKTRGAVRERRNVRTAECPQRTATCDTCGSSGAQDAQVTLPPSVMSGVKR